MNFLVKKLFKKVNNTLLVNFLGLFVAYFWCSCLTLKSQESQYLFFGISIFVLIVSLRLRRNAQLKFGFIYPYISIIIASTVFIILFFIWNQTFNWYSNSNSYTGNIFRGVFNGLSSPFYGRLVTRWMTKDSLIIISSIVFLIFAFIWRHNWHTTKNIPFLISLIGLLILSFGWTNSLEGTFSSSNCHYQTFASDLPKFDSIHQLITQYNQQISLLGIHNNHYPPGNLLLLKIEELYWPYLSKTIVFLATLFTLFPLFKLMQIWGFNKSERLISFIFYGTSGAILFYPGIAMSPLMLPLSISGFYFMIKGIENQKFAYFVAFAFIFSIYTFFTFSSLLFGFFCLITLLFKLMLKEISGKQIMKFGLSSFFVFVIIYWAVYLTFQFNIIECFISSLSNEKIQMDYSSIDNWSRYLLTSTGNILAYTGIIGTPVIGIIFYGLQYHSNMPKQLKSLIYALISTVLILGFSNQFFLEVERIWIFMTPFFLIVSGWLVSQFYKEEKHNLVFSLIFANLVVSVILSISINHCR